jgi:hypothetical protein
MSGLTYQVGIKLQLRFRKLKFWEGIRQSLLEKLEDSRSNWILQNSVITKSLRPKKLLRYIRNSL